MVESVEFSRIGFGNYVSTNRILALVQPEAAPVKRLIQEAKDRGALIDATAGRKTKTVLVMDSDHVVLSALDAEQILPAEKSQTVDSRAGHAAGPSPRKTGK